MANYCSECGAKLNMLGGGHFGGCDVGAAKAKKKNKGKDNKRDVKKGHVHDYTIVGSPRRERVGGRNVLYWTYKCMNHNPPRDVCPQPTKVEEQVIKPR